MKLLRRMKNVRGLPKSIIAKYGISKKAWSVFRGRRSRSSPRRVRQSSRKLGGKIRTMARRYRGRRRGKGSMTLPLAPIIGLIPMVAPAIKAAMDGGDAMAIASNLAWNTLGIADLPTGHARFDGGKLVSNLTPLIAGLLVHKFVGGSPLNLNRTLARARVPFIRI